jgi:hypothetical protein
MNVSKILFQNFYERINLIKANATNNDISILPRVFDTFYLIAKILSNDKPINIKSTTINPYLEL